MIHDCTYIEVTQFLCFNFQNSYTQLYYLEIRGTALMHKNVRDHDSQLYMRSSDLVLNFEICKCFIYTYICSSDLMYYVSNSKFVHDS